MAALQCSLVTAAIPALIAWIKSTLVMEQFLLTCPWWNTNSSGWKRGKVLLRVIGIGEYKGSISVRDLKERYTLRQEKDIPWWCERFSLWGWEKGNKEAWKGGNEQPYWWHAECVPLYERRRCPWSDGCSSMNTNSSIKRRKMSPFVAFTFKTW